MAQGSGRDALQGTDIQKLVPVVPVHEGCVRSLSGYHKGPGHGPGVEAAASPGQIYKGTSSAHTA